MKSYSSNTHFTSTNEDMEINYNHISHPTIKAFGKQPSQLRAVYTPYSSGIGQGSSTHKDDTGIGFCNTTDNNNSKNINEEEDDEDFHYEDDEIQRDAANEMVAYIVYIALGFFLFLFFGITVFIIIIVGNYGFFVLMIIIVLVLVVLAFGKFLLQIMDKDSVLKPARRKMKRWRAIATAVVVNEIKNFHMDMNDHLLLSYDSNYEDDCADGDGGKQKKEKKMRFKGTRSKIFALVVHPLLVKKNGKRRFGRKNRKDKKGTNKATVGSKDNCQV